MADSNLTARPVEPDSKEFMRYGGRLLGAPAHRHLHIKLLELFSFNSFHIRVIAPLIDVPD